MKPNIYLLQNTYSSTSDQREPLNVHYPINELTQLHLNPFLLIASGT